MTTKSKPAAQQLSRWDQKPYLEGHFERKRSRAARDITPEPEQDDSEYETAGNLICLPGVTLASIRPDGGDDPGPRAA